MAKPDIKNGLIGSWAESIQNLASLPNLYCKLSGMVTEANWNSWKPEDFYPYLDVVFKAFGYERLMIGSDWPVCLTVAEYSAVMSIVIQYIEHYHPMAKEAILGGNCRRFYFNQPH
jgi:L-fuconolactonase